MYYEPVNDDLDQQVKLLTEKIERTFPLLKGTISELSRFWRKYDVKIDRGKRQGVKPWSRFIVSEAPTSPVQTFKKELIQVVVHGSALDESTARLISRKGKEEIRVGDFIYTLDPSVKRGISVRMLWRQKVAKKRRRTRWVCRGFFVIPFGPNGSCRKPRLTDGSR